MALTDFSFSHRLRVRWAEVDPQGVVFNGNYLTYFDVAVTEYWRVLGYTYPAAFLEAGVDTLAVKAGIEFKSPARYDDEIDVLVRAARVGRTSLRFALEVHRDGTTLVEGELVYVFVSPEDRRPVPVPAALRAAISAYERKPPESN
jgi:acyl-CoA thioester hydrolase